MICPKCNTEYREGSTECMDCGVDLVNKSEQKFNSKITEQGISIIKYGVNLLFVTFLEIIIVMIAYEFYWVYKLSNGGVTGSAFTNIHPIIWIILTLQIVIAVGLVIWGISKKSKL